MNAAAAESILPARLRREKSISIKVRSAATVESRSSHKTKGRAVSDAMLRTNARDFCALGPSEPSMLIGRPSTTAPTLSLVSWASNTSASSENFLRMMTGRGWEKDSPLSDTAMPIVLSPRSSPASVLPFRR
ncbi:hypothetical protein ASD44_05590 [Mesorhizobium sp. Root554]|nr:hypothetical protein ASD27_05595 [Mesorhizobium sp. Root1471]KQZ36114.1 hypothetical protein ASD44_05590 [Mesorhizobium sp. Root554]